MKRLLITGVSGFLGTNLGFYGRREFHLLGIYHNRLPRLEGVTLISFDLKDLSDLDRLLDELRPDMVLHNAALANPDTCEKEPELAELLNVQVTTRLCKWCNRHYRRFVFTSTDLVFDGHRPPYKETDQVNPLGVYASSKVAAEEEILKIGGNALVVRLSLMYGRGKGGLEHQSEWMERELLKRQQAGCNRPLLLFHDQYRTYLSVDEAARALLRLVQMPVSGVLHLGGAERVSRYRFGQLYCEQSGIPLDCIQPVSMKDIPQSALRPADVSLDSARACKILGEYASPLEQAVRGAYSDFTMNQEANELS